MRRFARLATLAAAGLWSACADRSPPAAWPAPKPPSMATPIVPLGGPPGGGGRAEESCGRDRCCWEAVSVQCVPILLPEVSAGVLAVVERDDPLEPARGGG